MPYVSVGNTKIYYEMEGNGDPIVFLHGLSNNSQSWKKQIKDLKSNFTVIAWDTPGYGKSDDAEGEIRHFYQLADILKGFVEKLGLKSIFLVGHSMGSGIAVEFATRFPSMIKGLILADPTRGAAGLTKEENEKKLQQRLYNIQNTSPEEMANNRITALVSKHASEEIKDEVKGIIAQIRPSGYSSIVYSLYNMNQMDKLKKINQPTLVICGELDEITPVSEANSICESIPNAELALIPNTGHLCYQENPSLFNKYIHDFISKWE